ncbi:GTPase IMAP family member 5-like [Notolabrus celidotus]|uniref:GTPase IMAP family member 5-like n=1 Tax=Notolabrus celidotus TaxID=1203425 RepID=UPI00148F6856|nr:GTPase IMAP family member 5-like [Notolabrus celidotus]
MALSQPGPHLFIMAVDPENTEEEKVVAQISKLHTTFGDNMTSHLVIMLPDGKTYNSLSYRKDLNIMLVILTDSLASDCRKLCDGRQSFLYDDRHYSQYSQDVVKRRKATLEERRTHTPSKHRLTYNWEADGGKEIIHHGSQGSNPIVPSYPDLSAYERETPGQHIGNGVHCAYDDTFNIILLGLTRTGKSASANTILAAGTPQKDSSLHFRSGFSSMPVTTKCEAKIIRLFGGEVRVVDTPDFFHDGLQNHQAQVEECKRYCTHGRCLVLLVIQLSRFTDQEEGILEKLENMLGMKIREITFVLLTHGEDLKEKLEQFVRGNYRLWKIIEMCGYRYHLFKNSSKDTKQVRQLMKKVRNWTRIFTQLEKSSTQAMGCPAS